MESFNFLIELATRSPLRVASSTNFSISCQEIWFAKAELITRIAKIEYSFSNIGPQLQFPTTYHCQLKPG